MEFDFTYLCDNLGHLSGLQTRLYQNHNLVHQYSFYHFDPDLASFILPQIQAAKQNVTFFETADVLVFGMVQVPTKNIRILIGPTSAIKPSLRQAKTILHALGGVDAKLPALCGYLDNMICYPLENFLQILCFCSYTLNGEKINVADLLERYTEDILSTPRATPKIPDEEAESAIGQHNTFEMEKQMLGYITTGQTARLEQLLAAPPTGRAGQMAHDSLRQQKNLLVCTATLASRAAIAGGLSPETAFSLSDQYIQKSELLQNMAALAKLNMVMVLDYTHRVERLKIGENPSTFTASIACYVQEHIHTRITTEQLASALYMNRQYVCERFKSETGLTVGEFITRKKIDEAKRLLKTTEMPIAQISDFLCFCSQSYFQNVFKRNVGKTPLTFRRDMASW